MNRYRRDDDLQEPDEKAPTEAWLFAQAILGKPIPKIVSPETRARAKREELERLAQFYSHHAEELHSLQRAAAEARHDREVLEFAAKISTRAEAKLAAIVRKETEQREAWRRAKNSPGDCLKVKLRSLESGTVTRRIPYRSPNGTPTSRECLWALPRAANGHEMAGTEVLLAPSLAPLAIAAQQTKAEFVATPTGGQNVGHHWVPKGVVFRDDIRPFLSDKAVEYAMGAI